MARRGWSPARRDNNDQVASPALLRLMGLVIGIASLASPHEPVEIGKPLVLTADAVAL